MMKKKQIWFDRNRCSWRINPMCSVATVAYMLALCILLFSLPHIVRFSTSNLQTPPSRDSPQNIIQNDGVNVGEIFGQGNHHIEDEERAFEIQRKANVSEYENINNADLIRVMNQSKIEGRKLWEELSVGVPTPFMIDRNGITAKDSVCPPSISAFGEILHPSGVRFFPLPCGMKVGSSITIAGKPRLAQWRLNRLIGEKEKVSQFFVEVKGFQSKGNEMHPPTILHLNPRLYGDWSGKPVIEHNSRSSQDKWGKAHRCEGIKNVEKVDGQSKCENWLEAKGVQTLSESTKKSGRNRKVSHIGMEKGDRNYPFVEGQEFLLTIQADLEGFHVIIDNHHISSFAYQPGFSIEEASGIVLGGDIDVDFISATSLPEDDTWKALPIPTKEIEMFVGIMSDSNHFDERMTIRKTWLQSSSIRSSQVATRFFVALHKNKDINSQLLKEASYYGDIIILPFIDKYDIVVLKTLEICKFGVNNVKAKYIMKCDDDTFVRIDGVLEEVQKAAIPQGLYMGNMNDGHWPLRKGKWGVTTEEWPDQLKYPLYANGPGYVLSKDIAKFVVELSEKEKLQFFKMEDVSVGLWANKFALEKYPVKYVNMKRFLHNRCKKNYLCLHYQRPRQMMYLWDKLRATNEARCW